MMASYTEQQQQITETPPTGPGNVARLVDRLSKDISTLQKGVPMKPPKPNNNPTRTVQVRYSYVAQQEDELTLEENDIIEVLEDVEDGWARGKLNDKIGVFPTNFVSPTATPTINTSSYTSALSRVNEEPRKRPKEEQTNGKTDKTPPTSGSTNNNVLPSTFKASVRNKNGFSSTAASTAPTTTSVNTTATNTPPTTANKQSPAKETAKVLYEYKAVNPDELELKEGDIITIINRKCTDEGWFLGELNGKRGLFPENFVRIITTGAGPPPSSAMSTSNSTAPPVLPAKPLKPVGGFPKQEASSGPAVTTRTSFKNGTKYTPTPPTNTATTATSSDSTPSVTTAPSHKTLEERKSVVAGIQSKLFPQGKMPPHKPTFNPPSNVLTSSQHGHSDSNAPSVQMRHSVVDPTKMGGHFDVPESATDEPRQLESLTKFRPKQSGKRPPSTQFRSSNMIKVDTPPQTPPQTPTASAPEAVPVGPSTTSFPAESRSPAQQSSPNNTNSRQQEIHSAVKELDSIATAVSSVGNKASPTGQSTMGQKPSRNHSAGSTHSNFYKDKDAGNDSVDSTTMDLLSKAEFNDFKAEVFRRLAKLEEKILKLENADNNRQHF